MAVRTPRRSADGAASASHEARRLEAQRARERTQQGRAIAALLTVFIATATPVVLAGNGLWALAHPLLPGIEYALPTFPDDRLGLTDAQRSDLARTGVQAVHPLDGKGISRLREARMPDGSAAFGARELRHMEDVRGLLAVVAVAWLVALALVPAAALGLFRLRGWVAARKALTAGALATLALTALVALPMVVMFTFFFEGLHGPFFDGDSWRFSDATTLRSLYPYAFWRVAGGALALLVVAQAVAIVAGLRTRRAHAARSLEPAIKPESRL